ncbi:hypothetical protein F9U44_20730 [Pectobacterium versatile]|uniref:hypothetical protein n=1 Tax=Pectobacterium versatile TaxID=2488639 RepID=UPI001B3A5749|nr:hypothetical protein [Pectobacterium versatile]MBQ4773929.1 hypothetical protein [Pectobacterium versatile]
MGEIKIFINETLSNHLVKLIFSLFLIIIIIAFLIHSSYPMVSDLMMKIGPIILGVGIFTGLTRTKFYTDFFQRVIFSVFYTPSENIKPYDLTEKWKILTNAILKNVTEKFYDNGTNKIYTHYLDIKTDYHYSDMEITFLIELKDDDIIQIEQTIKNKIIVNESCKEINMEQVFLSYEDHNNGFEVKEILINGKPHGEMPTPTGDKNKAILIISIDTSKSKEIFIERKFIHRQNVSKDPIFTQEYVRFVQGISVKYKTKKCNVHVYKMGYNNMIDEKNIYKDSNGFYRVTISEPDDLTLPGQGYILVMTPKKVIKVEGERV